MPTILSWRLGALGDTVLLLPALAALRAACPAHHIVACGRVAALAPALWSGLADCTLGAAGEGPHLLPCLDVAELAAVLARAAVVVSGDSGVAHLAALLDVPSVVLFGPTDHSTWGPPGEHTTVLRLALPCSPCGEVARQCPSRMCLRGLSCEAVHAAVHARLALHGASPVGGAPYASVGTVPRLAPCVPAECHPPAPVPGPPGVLPVARWAHGRIWAARPPSAPE